MHSPIARHEYVSSIHCNGSLQKQVIGSSTGIAARKLYTLPPHPRSLLLPLPAAPPSIRGISDHSSSWSIRLYSCPFAPRSFFRKLVSREIHPPAPSGCCCFASPFACFPFPSCGGLMSRPGMAWSAPRLPCRFRISSDGTGDRPLINESTSAC